MDWRRASTSAWLSGESLGRFAGCCAGAAAAELPDELAGCKFAVAKFAESGAAEAAPGAKSPVATDAPATAGAIDATAEASAARRANSRREIPLLFFSFMRPRTLFGAHSYAQKYDPPRLHFKLLNRPRRVNRSAEARFRNSISCPGTKYDTSIDISQRFAARGDGRAIAGFGRASRGVLRERSRIARRAGQIPCHVGDTAGANSRELFHAGGRRKCVPAAIHAEMGARDDQLVDLRGLKMFEQRGNVVVDAVFVEAVRLD